jgi:hypothetical protein
VTVSKHPSSWKNISCTVVRAWCGSRYSTSNMVVGAWIYHPKICFFGLFRDDYLRNCRNRNSYGMLCFFFFCNYLCKGKSTLVKVFVSGNFYYMRDFNRLTSQFLLTVFPHNLCSWYPARPLDLYSFLCSVCCTNLVVSCSMGFPCMPK